MLQPDKVLNRVRSLKFHTNLLNLKLKLTPLSPDMPASGCYFAAYEATKCYFRQKTGSDDLSFFHVLVAGGFAGWANWAWGIAPDVVKTRYQTGLYSLEFVKTLVCFLVPFPPIFCSHKILITNALHILPN